MYVEALIEQLETDLNKRRAQDGSPDTNFDILKLKQQSNSESSSDFHLKTNKI